MELLVTRWTCSATGSSFRVGRETVGDVALLDQRPRDLSKALDARILLPDLSLTCREPKVLRNYTASVLA